MTSDCLSIGHWLVDLVIKYVHPIHLNQSTLFASFIVMIDPSENRMRAENLAC